MIDSHQMSLRIRIPAILILEFPHNPIKRRMGIPQSGFVSIPGIRIFMGQTAGSAAAILLLLLLQFTQNISKLIEAALAPTCVRRSYMFLLVSSPLLSVFATDVLTYSDTLGNGQKMSL